MPLIRSTQRLKRKPMARAIDGLATLAVLIPFAAAAQTGGTSTGTLAPVEVIGVTPLPGLNIPRGQVPANVQTGNAQDIERLHADDLARYMNRALGSVHIGDIQNNPFQPDVNYRGFTASPLLGTAQGLSVYLDGVRLNQPFGDVVSWDLIPLAAISTITLMPGSNPLFGLNTLGGALSVQTKDGVSAPGTSVQMTAGSHGRASLEFESGGGGVLGPNWYVTGKRLRDGGWRDDSPSSLKQLFGKFGWRSVDTLVSLTAAVADNDLTGNGLQEQGMLARDRSSVYTKPDKTHNRSLLLNLAGTQQLNSRLSLSGNVYYRRIRTRTLNGDINDDSLDQALYQPDAIEQAALTAAGFTGFPTNGEGPANTAFPKWRCIAQALLVDEPAEKCNGLLNTTAATQRNYGMSGQFNWDGELAGLKHQLVGGAAIDVSRVKFDQGSQLGFLTPDRGVTGVGAFGDGVTGGEVDGEPYDTRVDLASRTRTWSLFATDTIALGDRTHLTLAGRYNRSTVRNRDAILPGGGAGSLDGDHVFSRLNPALGLTFAPRAGLGVYAGINQGSRAPSAIELGCADPANPCKLPNAMAGDPALKQVVTTTIEAGVRGRSPGGLRWNVGVFRSDNKDDILFVADNQAGFGHFKNFGKTRRQGLEAGLAMTVKPGLTAGMNYTFLDATYRSTETLNGSSNSSNEQVRQGFPGVDGTIVVQPGNRIPLIPRHLLKVFADWRVSPQWSFGADVAAIGGSLARGNENGQHHADGQYYLGPGRSAGYLVLNLGAEYRPTGAWRLFVQVNNVFDRKYDTASQLGANGFDAQGHFQARPFPADANGDRPLQHSTFFAPGAPRSVVVGIRYAFGR